MDKLQYIPEEQDVDARKQQEYEEELDGIVSLSYIEKMSLKYGVPEDVIMDDFRERALEFKTKG